MNNQDFDEAISALEHSILHFPIGVKTKNHFKPLDEKILDIRDSLVAINSRSLTVKAIIDFSKYK
jgi:hypothetical protein